MKPTTLLTALAIAATLVTATAQQMNFQGRLTDNLGAARPGPIATLNFSIWDAPTAGNQVWGTQQLNADLIDGRFSVKLGDATGDDGNGNLLSESFGAPRYIQIQVGTEPALPRQEVLSSPTAFAANTLSDSSNTIAYARNGFFEVPAVSSFGAAFSPLPANQTNLLNILSGGSDDGGINGISFFENDSFGMSLGYDGVGSGATNALRIYDNSDAALFTFEHGGEFGIGTTTPAAPLDVNGTALFDGFTSDGNSTVVGTLSVTGDSNIVGTLSVTGDSNITGSYRHSSRETIKLGPGDFVASDSNDRIINNGFGGVYAHSGEIYAPINLPAGSRILKFTCYLEDSVTANLGFELGHKHNGVGGSFGILRSWNSSSVSGAGTVVSNLSHTVSTDRSIFLRVYSTGGGWPGNETLSIKTIAIEYDRP